MPDLLSLDLGGAAMVILRLCTSAGLMRWSHVVEVIRTPKFECSKVFGNSAPAHAVDELPQATQHPAVLSHICSRLRGENAVRSVVPVSST
jgi:hypothetical protein